MARPHAIAVAPRAGNRRGERRSPAAARTRRRREEVVALAAKERSFEDEFQPDRHLRRREDRRRPVRRTRNRAAHVRRGRRRDRIPARIAAREGTRRPADGRFTGEGCVAYPARRFAASAREVADARPRSAARDDDRGRERRRQDDEHRQAGEASAELQPVGAACCRRHVPRRRPRTAHRLGRAQQRDGDRAGKRRCGRRHFRRGRRGARPQDRRDDGRHGRPSADAAASDGRTAQGAPRDRESHAGRAARSAARDRRKHGSERARASEGVRRCARLDRPDRHQTRRHGERRHSRGNRAAAADSGVLHRRGRESRGLAAVQGGRIRRRVARLIFARKKGRSRGALFLSVADAEPLFASSERNGESAVVFMGDETVDILRSVYRRLSRLV
ncbi:hypothetical protein BURKHO8Y_140075 [Burkholderia sp. 8Y]|nr:hypothetical protein BURKHO8Y_140075 [Burkholderia sp. 8Y]